VVQPDKIKSKHYVSCLKQYEVSYLNAFKQFYGELSDYTILALLPSYLDRKGSSLIYMVADLIKQSGKPKSGFYLDDFKALHKTLNELDKKVKKFY